MRAAQGFLTLAVAGILLTGCQKPYFMTELDYEYYNKVSGDYDRAQYDPDLEVVAGVAPRTVRRPAAAEQWNLSLEETKRIALGNNKQIAVLANQPGAIGATIEQALSAFDTFYEAGGQWGTLENQVTSNIQVLGTGRDAIRQKVFGTPAGGYGINASTGASTDQAPSSLPGQNLLSLFKRNAAGGLTRISYSLDYQNLNPVNVFTAVNPAWTSTVGLTMQQPLLQGAGVEFNRAPVLIARANFEQSIKEFDTNVRTLLRDVENGYWQLYFTYQDLYSREVGMRQALATWQREFSEYEVGKGALPDVAQAREQFEFFRAAFYQAQNRVLLAEGQLRNLMGLQPDDNRQIIPTDDPSTAAYEPNWDIAVGDAMELRPELSALRFVVRRAELELFREQNGLLPDLSVVGNYSVSGLENEFDQAFNTMLKNKFTTWTVGVRARRAIGERAAHAGVRAANLNLSQARANLRNQEHTIMHQLREAYQNLVTNYELINVQRARREAAADQLKAREQFYLVGATTIDLLLQAQSIFADALRDESQAVVQYNQSLAEWEFAKGTIMSNDNVILAEEMISKTDRKVLKQRQRQYERSLPFPIHPGSAIHGYFFPCPDKTKPLYPQAPREVGKLAPTEVLIQPEKQMPTSEERSKGSTAPAEFPPLESEFTPDLKEPPITPGTLEPAPDARTPSLPEPAPAPSETPLAPPTTEPLPTPIPENPPADPVPESAPLAPPKAAVVEPILSPVTPAAATTPVESVSEAPAPPAALQPAAPPPRKQSWSLRESMKGRRKVQTDWNAKVYE